MIESTKEAIKFVSEAKEALRLAGLAGMPDDSWSFIEKKLSVSFPLCPSSPGTSANSDGGKAAWKGLSRVVYPHADSRSHRMDEAYLRPVESANPWRLLTEDYYLVTIEPAATRAQAPALPTAEPSEPLPTATNQEKIPASQDLEGKEK